MSLSIFVVCWILTILVFLWYTGSWPFRKLRIIQSYNEVHYSPKWDLLYSFHSTEYIFIHKSQAFTMTAGFLQTSLTVLVRVYECSNLTEVPVS